jgi:hypothetical protein
MGNRLYSDNLIRFSGFALVKKTTQKKPRGQVFDL